MSPRITIVTPSFNQALHIERTICSVLDQNYANLEYILIDGGSTDRSIEIIKKYERHLTHSVSENDRGRTPAINKGMAQATGDVRAYLDIGDLYLPGALYRVGEHFADHPETDLLHGRCRILQEDGRVTGEQFGSITEYSQILDLWNVWWAGRHFVQPEVFWSRRIAQRIGPFNEDLCFAVDYDYWLRAIRHGANVSAVDFLMACVRQTPAKESIRAEEVSNELLRLVKPMLWERSGRLCSAERRRLQGLWLYDSIYRPAAGRSAARGESPGRRRLLLATLLLVHPQLWRVPRFRRRLADRLRLPALGRLKDRTRERFRHGVHVAWQRDVTRSRILATSAVDRSDDTCCEIHCLTSKADWLNLVWALKSFYRASGRHYALCVHDDGTLQDEQFHQLRSHFPQSRVISRSEADARVEPLLAQYPRCAQFRRANHFGPKILDCAALSRSERILLFDSDVLFFKEPTELLRRIEDQNYRFNTVNGDFVSAYTITPTIARAHAGVELIERFNSGLGLIHRGSLQLDWIEQFLALPEILGNCWLIEQTLHALCSSRWGADLLPPEYSVHVHGSIVDAPCRHYVGAIRHLFYGEGIPKLVRRGILRQPFGSLRKQDVRANCS